MTGIVDLSLLRTDSDFLIHCISFESSSLCVYLILSRDPKETLGREFVGGTILTGLFFLGPVTWDS